MSYASPTGSSLDVPCPARTALRLAMLSLATVITAAWLIIC
jgi:hypothetical protein